MKHKTIALITLRRKLKRLRLQARKKPSLNNKIRNIQKEVNRLERQDAF